MPIINFITDTNDKIIKEELDILKTSLNKIYSDYESYEQHYLNYVYYYNLITALSIIWSWEIYLFTLIALLAYTPLSLKVTLVSPFEKTLGQFFGYPLLVMILQSIATIFLFIAIYIYFYEDLNFIETIIESILITFGKNGVSSALFLFIITFILLIQ